jgi:hypothetical protein
MELWNYAKCCDSTQTMQTRLRLCISQLTRQSHSLEMFASVLEFLGYNITRLEEHGRRLVVPLYAFTLMRALAKKIDTSPWAKQVSLHPLIIDVIRLGDPHVAEQTLIHVTNSFLLTVWAH